eukprot:9480383-Pyramimonas_sp.AAC.3
MAASNPTRRIVGPIKLIHGPGRAPLKTNSPTEALLNTAPETTQASPSLTLKIIRVRQGQNVTRNASTRGGGARGPRGRRTPAGELSAVWVPALSSGRS